jgi:hypothetical protein
MVGPFLFLVRTSRRRTVRDVDADADVNGDVGVGVDVVELQHGDVVLLEPILLKHPAITPCRF